MVVCSLIEVSFFRSLPGFFTLTPLVFALSVYFVQHQGVNQFIWWLPIHGIFLDSLLSGFITFNFFPFVVAAILVSFSAKHLFSNRSYYGVLSCALMGYVGLILTEAIILFIQQFSNLSFDWSLFLREALLRLILLLIVITIFFPFAKRIRGILVSLSLLPEPRKTY